MLLGAVLGVFSNDLKRTLACSSVSQIGFILTGVAMQVLLEEHNALAVRGTALHMLNHSLCKLVLFVAAGVVYMNRHELEFGKIRGFGRGKPLFLFVFLMATFGICGLPLWSGYVSKTLLHESIIEGIHLYHGLPLEFPLRLLDAVFFFAGGLTVAYMTRLFVVLFVERCEMTVEEKCYISRPSAVALAASAALPPLMGCFPAIMDALADWGQRFFHGHAPDNAVHYFAWENLRGVVISVTIGIGIYFFVVRGLLMRRGEGDARIYAALWPEWLDLENLIYRPLLRFLVRVAAFLARVAASLPDTLSFLIRLAVFLARVAASLPDVLMWLALFTVLRVSRKPYIPGRFLSRHYWAFHRRPQPLREESVMIGGFSVDLLFVGVGLCIALLYVFHQSFR